MPSFPDSIFSPASKNTGNTIQAAHISDLDSEVVAIEQGLRNGTAPLNSSNSTFVSLSAGNSTLGNLSVSSHSTFAGSVTFSSMVTLSAQPRVHLRHASTLSVATATQIAPNWDTEVYDVGGLHAVNSSAVVLTASGTYRLLAHGDFAASSAGVRLIYFYKNGAELIRTQQGPSHSGDATSVQLSYESTFAAGDALVTYFYQNSGSTLSIGVVNNPFFVVSRVY